MEKNGDDPIIPAMDMQYLRKITETEDTAMRFLQSHQFFKTQQACPNCNNMMRLTNAMWRCGSCQKKLSIRNGTFFEGLRLPFVKIIDALYLFAHKTTFRHAKYMLSISNDATDHLFRMFRVGIHEAVSRRSVPVGGVGRRVQIDEAIVVKAWRGRSNKGRPRLNSQRWILGVIEEGTKHIVVQEIPDRTKATMQQFIYKWVRRGSTVLTDAYSSYKWMDILPPSEYTHISVNHTEFFVNPKTGDNTNAIEWVWRQMRHCFRERHAKRFHSNEMGLYFAEFLWRYTLGGHDPKTCFPSLMQLLSESGTGTD